MNKLSSGKVLKLMWVVLFSCSLHLAKTATHHLEEALADTNRYQNQVTYLELKNGTYEQQIEDLQLALQSSIVEELDTLSTKEMFQIASKAYNVDFNLVYSIAILETGNFTSNLFLKNNNPGGISKGNGWASYSTRFEGIMEMCRLLRYNYLDYGLTTPEAIGSKYCPNPEEGWAAKVNQLMLTDK